MFKTYSLCFHQISFLLQEAASLVAQMIKRLPAVRETRVRSLGREAPLEKEMETHSSMLAWRIPWTEEPGGLPSMGSRRVGHDWATSLSFLSFYKNRGLLGGSVVKNPPATQETQVPSRGWEDPLEEEMATLSRLLAWETPWTEEPGGLQSMGSQRVGHNWSHWTEQQTRIGPSLLVPAVMASVQKTSREAGRHLLTARMSSAQSGTLSIREGEGSHGASLSVCPGLCGVRTHTKIIYTLAHRGGCLLGVCLWLTPFRLLGSISSQLLPRVLETEFHLVVCELSLCSGPGWAKLGGAARTETAEQLGKDDRWVTCEFLHPTWHMDALDSCAGSEVPADEQ